MNAILTTKLFCTRRNNSSSSNVNRAFSEVTATVSGNKSVSAKVTDSGVLIAVDQKVVRGSAASLVLQSKNADGSVVKAVVKVKVQNRVKKLSVKKKSVVLKKGRKTKIVLIVKAQNNKKAVTDAVKISSKLVRNPGPFCRL